MSQTTILVIDDSATIRKMVDSHLSKEGYRVVLAPTAEEGLQLAPEVQPNVILLDHQLPGTTGIEVATQLFAMADTKHIPVVVSSTLRKQAYIEYTDMANVVDSLPKPYTGDLLRTTIANAVENGALIVNSQSGGTAVPEVIEQQSNASLSGDLEQFGMREILDFLNNSQHTGMLEIETALDRVYFYLRDGRIQAVVSPSINDEEIAATLPEKMKDLGPLLKFTASTGFSSQVSGLVELLDHKVLDPRMLRSLLRHQAAHLTRHCFTCGTARSFAFEAGRPVPGLFQKSQLNVSLAALLVDGANLGEPTIDENAAFVRRALRGQNLDRSGLEAGQLKLLSHLEEPQTIDQLVSRSGLSRELTTQAIAGFVMAEWVEQKEHKETRQLIAMESERTGAALLRDVLANDDTDLSGRVVRDRLGLQLLLKRNRPDAVLLPCDTPEAVELAQSLRDSKEHSKVPVIAIASGEPDEQTQETIDQVGASAVLTRPYALEDVLDAVDKALLCQPVEA